jgi:uncharacterized protein (TIGR02145 family)
MKTSASSADSMRNNGIIEKYCYSNLTTNCDLYGGLYQWSEAMQYITTSGSQGVCPPGWHIPTSSEFQTLSSSVGGSGYALLKIGQSSGTNTSDFNGLLTGYRSSGGSFSSLSSTTYLLTSDSYSSTNTTYYYLSSNTISSGNISKATGFSVRCLKNN